MSSTSRDPADDFVAQLLELIASCSGGFEEQMASQLEEQIRSAWGGQAVYVHRAGWFDRAERDQRIRADRAAGRSIGWIANRYCLSRSTVFGVLRSAGQGEVVGGGDG